MSRYYRTISSEYPYCVTEILKSERTVGIFTSLIVLQYLDITYYSTPACFNTFYCSATIVPTVV